MSPRWMVDPGGGFGRWGLVIHCDGCVHCIMAAGWLVPLGVETEA